MVLVLGTLASTAFGMGVIMGLAVGGSAAACAYACREARRVEAEERPPRPRAEPREERPSAPAGRRTEGSRTRNRISS
jgi:hypothetical protein